MMKHVCKRLFVILALLAGLLLLAVPGVLLAGDDEDDDGNVPATATALVRMQQAIFATQTAMAATTTPAMGARTTATSTPVRRAAATPTPTRPTPTEPAPTRPAASPMAIVLAQGLNLRQGPGTNFAVVGNAAVGQQYPVTGRIGNCAWLRIMLEDGGVAWISGAPAYSTLTVACLSVPGVAAPAVAAATATPRPTVVKVAQQPAVAPTRAAAAAPGPTAAPKPAPGGADGGGPTSIGNLVPEDDLRIDETITFEWTPNAPLAPGQVYELVFWRPDEGPEQGRSWRGANSETVQVFKVEGMPIGKYYWGVYLASTDPNYHRIRYLGGGNSFQIQAYHYVVEDNIMDDPSQPDPIRR